MSLSSMQKLTHLLPVSIVDAFGRVDENGVFHFESLLVRGPDGESYLKAVTGITTITKEESK